MINANDPCVLAPPPGASRNKFKEVAEDLYRRFGGKGEVFLLVSVAEDGDVMTATNMCPEHFINVIEHIAGAEGLLE